MFTLTISAVRRPSSSRLRKSGAATIDTAPRVPTPLEVARDFGSGPGLSAGCPVHHEIEENHHGTDQ